MLTKTMISISNIRKQDLSRFVELWNQDYLLLTSRGWKMTQDKVEKGFNSMMFEYFGLYLENKLNGFMLLKKEDNILWLKHILIDKNFRGRDLGKFLLKKAIKQAKIYNVKLKTEVIKENEKVISFFTKNNFKIVKFDPSENQYILERKL